MNRQMRFFAGLAAVFLMKWLIGCTGDPGSAHDGAKDGRPANYGQRKPVAFDELKRNFINPDMIYAPFIFWFWDEPLNPEKMAEMARVMGSQGFNPGYAHARHSMVGTPSLPDSEWLGEKWFESFGAALEVAEKQDKYLGYCDEYWWPSFQANGRVLKKNPELRAESLQWQIIDAVGDTEVKVPESYFVMAARMATPLEPTLPQPQFGKWIWHPEGQQSGHTCWFRYSFEIPAEKEIAHAALRITADNEFEVYTNGEKSAEGNNWEKVVVVDLTENLTAGTNLLAVECRNLDGPFGLIAGIRIEFRDGEELEIGTDEAWLSTLSFQKGWELKTKESGQWSAVKVMANPGDNPWSVISNNEPYREAIISSKTIRLLGSGGAFNWQVPPGDMWRIYVFNKYYHAGAADGQQCNSIDNRLGPAFIQVALEPYASRFPDQMGKSIPGDFIDHEGDYGWQLAWSGSLDSSYSTKYGADIREIMPLMLDRDSEGVFAKARWRWFDLVSALYAGNFRAVTDWHEKRGMYTTAHVWEEGIQPQINCVGDHMRILRALTMPGQDCLGLKALRVHDFKEPQSVSEFENVRFASEVLGASDFEPGMGLWGSFTPSLLKQSVNAFTAWGVSHVIPHGIFTTRKLKGNPWPPDWYSDSPMFPWLHHWNDFARRASYINSMGSTVPRVLLYNPMETAWINANGPLLDVTGMWAFDGQLENGNRINEIDKVYAGAINDLTNARIEFLVGDRYYLEQMKAKKGRLVLGNFEFTTIVLPDIEILPLEVARKMVQFAKAGGYVYALAGLPSASAEHGLNDPEMLSLMDKLSSSPSFTSVGGDLKALLEGGSPGMVSDIRFTSGAFPMLQLHRKIDGRDFFWLVNNNDQEQNCELTVRGVSGAASVWDCETGEIRPVPSRETGDGTNLTLKFKSLEAFWLVFDPAFPANPPGLAAEPIVVLNLEQLWKVTYDPSLQPVMEFPPAPPAPFMAGVDKPLEDWNKWGLGSFSGLLEYTNTFDLDQIDNQMFIDLGKVFHVAEVWINGKSIGSRMWGPFVFDMNGAVRQGTNEIRIRVANLINNSYGDIKESGLQGPVQIKAIIN